MNFDNKRRVLIVGLPKSGTTILTYRVSAALGKAKIFFEPGKQNSLSNPVIHNDIYLSPGKTAISKSLFIPISGYDIPAIEKYYNRKIWIYRDPRDWIISRYLYKWKHLDDMSVNKFCAKLRKKEENPSGVNFYPLMTPNFIQKSIYNYNELISVLDELDDDWMVLKYEDFIKNKLGGINEYLGVDLDPSVEVSEKYSRVVRSKSYNNWKTWFNENDVNFFAPKLNSILNKLGYSPIDWSLENPIKIDSSLGSDYVKKLHSSKLNM